MGDHLPSDVHGNNRPDEEGGRFTVAVLGAGSWGTALAMQIARSGHRALLWGRDPAQVAGMQQARSNERFLPGLPFPPGLEPVTSLEEALRASDECLVAVPSHAFTGVVERLSAHQRPGQGLAWACKGLEPGSGRFLHSVAQDILGEHVPLAVVTGPSFAVEVGRNLPTAVTVAANDEAFAQRVTKALHGGNFRAYTSEDLVGAELGGAVKNVLAVATGIGDGLGLGNNARAALVTRGLAEMMRLGQALGAQDRTLTGLAGMGDLVLTCTGDLSRNRRLGLALGSGRSVRDALDEIGQVVEGVGTSEEVWRLGCRHQVEMPISEEVHGILHLGWDPVDGVRRLLSREPRSEAE
jgi:glycerol-3-phosphate dehydrogenase (NAD(P)+)